MNTYRIGGALEVLRTLPDGFAQTCVTSPPYWQLRDYNHEDQIGLEPTPEEYVAKLVEVFGEVRRVLRDDGTLWLNLGDSYAASAGSHRPYRPHLSGDDDLNMPRRFPPPPGLKPKDLIGIPWRVAFALRDDGWYLRSDIVWNKPNAMPESVTDRPTRAHEYVFLLSKRARYHYDADAVREPVKSESIERAKYAGADGTKWHDGQDSAQHRAGSGVKRRACLEHGPDNNPAGRNKRSVWTISTEPYPEAHFAVFPTALAKPCIMAGCPEGGVVLDPFLGSGTVGEVAEALGRKWYGIELNPEYEPLIRKRTEQTGMCFAEPDPLP